MNDKRREEYVGGVFCSAVGRALFLESSSLVIFFVDMSKRNNEAWGWWFGIVSAPGMLLHWLFPSLRIHCLNGNCAFTSGAFVVTLAGLINWFLVFYALLYAVQRWKSRRRPPD